MVALPFISKLSVARILRQLLDTIMNTINRSDKKNEVDELTEIISILYKKDLYEDDEGQIIYNEKKWSVI